MDKLLQSISKIDPQFPERYNRLKTFTTYAVEYRYPDFAHNLPPLTEIIVQEALELAEKVFNELTTLLSQTSEGFTHGT